MLKAQVEKGQGGRVILMDSITKLSPEDAGAIVVSASHGGVSSGEFALAVPVKVVFFNDAGVGKDNAGIVALDMLEARGVAAGTVAHTSARIGDSRDMWESGVISHVNSTARRLGLVPGRPLRVSLMELLSPVTKA
jgi:hypothetical protein